MRKAIAHDLVWIKERDQPRWRPDPANIAHAEEILETGCYQHDILTARDEEGRDVGTS